MRCEAHFYFIRKEASELPCLSSVKLPPPRPPPPQPQRLIFNYSCQHVSSSFSHISACEHNKSVYVSRPYSFDPCSRGTVFAFIEWRKVLLHFLMVQNQQIPGSLCHESCMPAH
jgi:hypothetical protein